MGDPIPTTSNNTPKEPTGSLVLKKLLELLTSDEASAADREAKLQILKFLYDLERGETETYREGYQVGYRAGFSTSYQLGFQDGYEEGYHRGFKDGKKDR